MYSIKAVMDSVGSDDSFWTKYDLEKRIGLTGLKVIPYLLRTSDVGSRQKI